MSLVLKGKVVNIGDEWENDGGTFKKRELLLEIDPGDYAQEIPIEVVNKRLEILNGVAAGDEVEVEINLRGNEWNGKHYLSANAWKLNVLVKGEGVPATAAADTGGADLEEDPDDLPF